MRVPSSVSTTQTGTMSSPDQPTVGKAIIMCYTVHAQHRLTIHDAQCRHNTSENVEQRVTPSLKLQRCGHTHYEVRQERTPLATLLCSKLAVACLCSPITVGRFNCTDRGSLARSRRSIISGDSLQMHRQQLPVLSRSLARSRTVNSVLACAEWAEGGIAAQSGDERTSPPAARKLVARLLVSE
jgi:hypothetical protein